MNRNTVITKLYGAAVILIFVLLAWVAPVFGQFSLVSVTPINGATNVSSPATIVLEFSQPLDTTAQFEVSAGFYLGIEIFPKDSVGFPEEVTISPDLKIVTAKNFAFTANTKFVLFLSGAKSMSGARLDRPYVATFSTGASLPTAMMSGNLAFAGGDPLGAVVGLSAKLPFIGEGYEPEAIAIVTSPTGSYSMPYIRPGTYWVLAFKDINGDGFTTLGVDAMGGYDANGDQIADRITIAEGENRSGINTALFLPAPVTARENFPTLQTLAQTQLPDAILSALLGYVISPRGRSAAWFYIFYSANLDSLLGFTKLGGLSFILTEVYREEEGPDFTVPLPGDWVDSDVATDSAEFYGGSAFRQAYPDAECNAGLFDAPLGTRVSPLARAANPARVKSAYSRSFAQFKLAHFSTAAVADTGVWFFSYYSATADEFINVVLEARTASPLQPPTPIGTTRAQINLVSANQAILSWAADAQLVMVGTHQSDLTPTGEAMMWFFIYHSASLDSEQVVILSQTNVLFMGPIWQPPSEVALPANWIDSPLAMGAAESHGGSQYRAMNQNVLVSGSLSRGLLQHEPQRAVWKLDYASSSSPPLTIFVDAMTGLIVSVEEQTANELPRNCALQQNYPNPFNPMTTIKFMLPQASLVTLKIYDLLGNEVATLVAEKLPAGKHHRVWEPKGLASGVYFYQLRAGNFSQWRKMSLLR